MKSSGARPGSGLDRTAGKLARRRASLRGSGEESDPRGRRRRATTDAAATPGSPKGCGGAAPSASSPLLTDHDGRLHRGSSHPEPRRREDGPSEYSDRLLRVSSFAKINLGLRVLGLRDDGYHEIRTVLQTIDLSDELDFEEAPGISLSVEGRWAVAADDSNLVLRAAHALSARYPGRGARIALRKAIPPGAGLGGGSGNAAATLLALDRLWGLKADPGLLYSIARGLGADVPFFLYGGACLGVGRGDEVYPLPDLPEWTVLVAWPGVELSTAEVYAGLPFALTRTRILSSMKGFLPVVPARASRDEAETTGGGLAAEGPKAVRSPEGGPAAPPEVDNDLEPPAFRMLPAVRRLKERLLDSGGAAAAMSGSGSAVFGLFPSSRGIDKVAGSLATGGTAVFVCHTLSRDAYRLKLFERSRT